MSLLQILGRKTEKALFNLEIDIDGWQGPFKDTFDFRYIAEKFAQAEQNYKGTFYVTESGKLERGNKEGLHTYKGIVYLSHIYPFENPHVHYSKGRGLDYLCISKEGVFLEDIKKDRAIDKRIPSIAINQKPIYTLKGLYASLPDQKMSTKINALRTELKAHRLYEFESIATGKETRLKLLEHKYREMISNQ